MPLERLLSVLASGCFGHVSLGHRRTAEAPPPEMPTQIVAALTGSSSSMLTAFHNLPLVQPEDQPPAALAAFTQLRTLTLRQTWDGPNILRLAQLPASLEELTLTPAAKPEDISVPVFVDLDSLPSLRRITCASYLGWELGSGDWERRPICVPPSFEVCCPSSGHCWLAIRDRLSVLGLSHPSAASHAAASPRWESVNGLRDAEASMWCSAVH